MRDRCHCNTLFLAIGRASEIGCSTFNTTDWDYDTQYPVIDWNEMKTGQQKIMNFSDQFDHYELDFYDSLSDYWAMGYGKTPLDDSGENFIFPELSANSGEMPIP